MPRHKVHRKICEIVLGKAHPDVDLFLDCTYPISGAKHRKDWVHSIYGALLYAMFKRDIQKFFAGIIHLALDNLDPITLKVLEHILNYYGRSRKVARKNRNDIIF